MIYWNSKDALLCFYGGLLIGTVAGCRMLIFGKVTGISGILSGLIEIKKKKYDLDFFARIFFVTGLVLAGIFANYYLPGCFQVWNVLPISRLVMAGFLVGFGTTTGNGCTSGHGVCGISAFRSRSIFATCTFMVAGSITAILSDTSSLLPVFSNSLDVHKSGMIIAACLATCLTVTGLAVAVRTSIGVTASFDNSKPVVFIAAVLFELLFGVSFGLALAVSNMTRLSATISFLDVRILNPALAFVMIAAISVSMFAYYLAGKRTFPFLDSKFYRPVGSIVDAKLFLGEVLFGVGWGLAGACPGPAITNLGSGGVIPVIYFGSIVAGMWIQHLCNPFLTKALEKVIFFGQQQPSAAPDKDLHRKIV